MPGTPVGELFRSFKSPPGWGGHYLEPDLTTYGVLKDEAAALFVEYDGYWRHAEKEGMVRDQLKNLTLLAFAPSGSFVVRISHKSGSKLDGHVLCIGADAWRHGDRKSLATTLKALLKQMLPRLEHVLHTDVKTHLQKQVRKEQMVISKSAQRFCEEAVIRGRGSTPKEISVFLRAQGFRHSEIQMLQKRALVSGPSIERVLQPVLEWLQGLGLNKKQVAKAVALSPQILGYSIEQNLKPTVQWLLDLGLNKTQVAKAVAISPQILGLSIEKNLKPTVQWLLDLGLNKKQVAKAVAVFPQILGYSIEQNLKPTAQWLLDLGLNKKQVAKAVAVFPQILGYSIEQNLKPTAQWLLDLGLNKKQVAKAVAVFPSILGLSIEQNLKPTAQWLLDLGLNKKQVAKAVAVFPQILGYSIEQNLKPTAQWLLDLGLNKKQVAKAVAVFPSILGLSIEQNLKPTVGWLLGLGLSRGEVVKAVADFPAILGLSVKNNLMQKIGFLRKFFTAKQTAALVARSPRSVSYSSHRLEDRLPLLAEQGKIQILESAMRLTDEAFCKRFLRGSKNRCPQMLCCFFHGESGENASGKLRQPVKLFHRYCINHLEMSVSLDWFKGTFAGNLLTRSILDGQFSPLVFWYQWDFLRSPAKIFSFFAGYLRLAMLKGHINPWFLLPLFSQENQSTG